MSNVTAKSYSPYYDLYYAIGNQFYIFMIVILCILRNQ